MPFIFNPLTGVFDISNSSGGGGTPVTTITGDSGGAETPDGAGNFNLKGTANQITVTGSANTETWSLPSAIIAPGSLTTTTTLTATTLFTASAGQVVARTAPGAYPYAVLTTDYIVEVNTGSARTIQLPNAPTTGQQFVIKDVTGTASSFNISLTTVGGAVTIDGATTYTINTNYAAIKVYFNGTSYFII